jgi:hypothetical protein
MKPFKIIALIAFLLGSVVNSWAQLISNPENTYAIVVGVLDWQGDLSSFEKRNRKDAEFQALLLDKGIPKDQLIALFDEQATIENIHKALETISTEANETSTVIFYYAGHGVKESGNIYFANYDIKLNDIVGSGFGISKISETFGKSKAKRVLLFADCCYSGGLIQECEKLGKVKKEALALTSATASNLSTGNWTFSQTLLDGWKGHASGDHNKDNIIQLSELKTELFDAMKFRERQMFGYAIAGVDENTKISDVTADATVCSSEEFCGHYFWAKHEKHWKPVRIVGTGENNTFNCEFYFYSDKVQKLKPRKQMKPLHFVTYSIGSSVEVEWKGIWYKAKVVDRKGDFSYIKYDGYDSTWNEWVLYDRVKTGKEALIQVEDGGSYYPAYLLETKGDKYYIRYKNYGSDWDEWVGEKRIKR